MSAVPLNPVALPFLTDGVQKALTDTLTRDTPQSVGPMQQMLPLNRQFHPGWIVVTPITTVFGSPIDKGLPQGRRQSRAQPDLVKQFVFGRLTAFFETVGPGW